jgi:hypothetical protein
MRNRFRCMLHHEKGCSARTLECALDLIRPFDASENTHPNPWLNRQRTHCPAEPWNVSDWSDVSVSRSGSRLAAVSSSTCFVHKNRPKPSAQRGSGHQNIRPRQCEETSIGRAHSFFERRVLPAKASEKGVLHQDTQALLCDACTALLWQPTASLHRCDTKSAAWPRGEQGCS